MNAKRNFIWYASYGSNLSEERFLCYIAGGQPKGTKRVYAGCTDKSLPLESEPILINRELYFARESATWGQGAVAFLKTHPNPTLRTCGRMYLITADQFVDLLKQEIDFDGELPVDWKLIEEKGSLVVKEKAWYGNILFLGIHEGFPIFTFTFENDEQKINKPGAAYLQTIINGLRECHGLSTGEIVAYLANKAGIRGNYSEEELKDLIND